MYWKDRKLGRNGTKVSALRTPHMWGWGLTRSTRRSCSPRIRPWAKAWAKRTNFDIEEFVKPSSGLRADLMLPLCEVSTTRGSVSIERWMIAEVEDEPEFRSGDRLNLQKPHMSSFAKSSYTLRSSCARSRISNSAFYAPTLLKSSWSTAGEGRKKNFSEHALESYEFTTQPCSAEQQYVSDSDSARLKKNYPDVRVSALLSTKQYT